MDAETLTPETLDARLGGAAGILVPGGFGARGIEGMVLAADWARRHKRPYLGICLGMQVAVIAAARSLAGLAQANSREFAPDGAQCVVDLMPDQQGNLPKGRHDAPGRVALRRAARHAAGARLRLRRHP